MVGSAWLEHAPFAFWITTVLKPRALVELGVHNGFSYFAFCQAAKTLALDAQFYAVDHWKGDKHSGFYGDEVFESVSQYNEQHYSAFSRLIRSPFDDAVSLFSEGFIDLLHIDGRHFYEDVSHDFEMWRPKLSDRAVVLLHDTNVREDDFGVWKFWEEHKDRFPSFEFSHGYGLGVLGIGRNLPEKLIALFGASADTEATQDVRCAYARLGASIRTEFVQSNKLEANQARNSELCMKLHAADDKVSKLKVELKANQINNAQLASQVSRLKVELKSEQTRNEGLASQVSRLKEELKSKQTRNVELTSQLKLNDRKICALAEELAQRDAQICAITRDRQRYRQLAEELQNSASWLVTAPLRTAARAIRWLGRNIRRTLILVVWAATGQSDRIASAVPPYLRKTLPSRLHGLIRMPPEVRQNRKEGAPSPSEEVARQASPKKFVAPARRRLSICFISNTSHVSNPILDGSVRYRCFHPAEALSGDGHKCCVVSQRRFVEMPSYDFDVYVFHRPASNVGPLHAIVETLKARGKIVIADYDDLIFGDTRLALDSSLAKRGGDGPKKAIAAFKYNTEGLRLFDRVTVATHPLAEKARQFHPLAKAEVMPNTLPESIFALSDKLKLATRSRPAKRIGYFCGTNTHNTDFNVAFEAILAVLDKFKDAIFVVVGPLKLPAALSVHPRVHTHPVCDYWYLSTMMSSCSVAIAPLERGEFNDCKSRVKFLEASVAGCRLVATPIDDMKRATLGNAALPTTNEEWIEALTSMLSDSNPLPGVYEFVRSNSHASCHAASLLSIVECASFST